MMYRLIYYSTDIVIRIRQQDWELFDLTIALNPDIKKVEMYDDEEKYLGDVDLRKIILDKHPDL